MEITPQEAFKLGFLARCAEEKLTGSALDARLEKVAELNKSASILPSWLPGSGVANDITAGYLALLSLPFGASILGGSALGYGAGNLVEPQIHDDELKANELATTYKLYADKARNRRKAVRYRAKNEASQSPQQSFDDIYARV